MQQNASAFTRRSAGLPALIIGILTAHVEDDFFDNILLDLQAIADMPIEGSLSAQELSLSQVHALNSLKDVFADARLGARSEPYVADSLDIAANCLDCTVYVLNLPKVLHY